MYITSINEYDLDIIDVRNQRLLMYMDVPLGVDAFRIMNMKKDDIQRLFPKSNICRFFEQGCLADESYVLQRHGDFTNEFLFNLLNKNRNYG